MMLAVADRLQCQHQNLNEFLDAHRDVASHLSKHSSEDQAYDVSVTNLGSGMVVIGKFLISLFLDLRRKSCVRWNVRRAWYHPEPSQFTQSNFEHDTHGS